MWRSRLSVRTIYFQMLRQIHTWISTFNNKVSNSQLRKKQRARQVLPWDLSSRKPSLKNTLILAQAVISWTKQQVAHCKVGHIVKARILPTSTNISLWEVRQVNSTRSLVGKRRLSETTQNPSWTLKSYNKYKILPIPWLLTTTSVWSLCCLS